MEIKKPPFERAVLDYADVNLFLCNLCFVFAKFVPEVIRQRGGNEQRRVSTYYNTNQ